MGIREDFAAYTNKLGFVTNGPGPDASSGNDLLFSVEAQHVLDRADALTVADYLDLKAAIVASAQIEPGLYRRPGQWANDNEAMDDYVAVAHLSPDFAGAILDYGRRHWGYFKTSSTAPWYEPIFWRWPALFAHVHWSAGETPNPFLRLAWVISVAFSGDATSLDPWKLNRLMVAQVEGFRYSDIGFLERWAIRRYWTRLRAAHGSLKNVYTKYFGADHPISRWCRE